jgi:hypothetical protein
MMLMDFDPVPIRWQVESERRKLGGAVQAAWQAAGRLPAHLCHPLSRLIPPITAFLHRGEIVYAYYNNRYAAHPPGYIALFFTRFGTTRGIRCLQSPDSV